MLADFGFASIMRNQFAIGTDGKLTMLDAPRSAAATATTMPQAAIHLNLALARGSLPSGIPASPTSAAAHAASISGPVGSGNIGSQDAEMAMPGLLAEEAAGTLQYMAPEAFTPGKSGWVHWHGQTMFGMEISWAVLCCSCGMVEPQCNQRVSNAVCLLLVDRCCGDSCSGHLRLRHAYVSAWQHLAVNITSGIEWSAELHYYRSLHVCLVDAVSRALYRARAARHAANVFYVVA